MKFEDFGLIGFDENQIKHIKACISPHTDMTQALLSDIADMTGHAIGMVFLPNGTRSIVRMQREG